MKTEFNVIEVTEIATGKLIKIKDFKFNPDLHSKTPVEAKEEVKEFKCEPCEKTFKREQDLKTHNKLKHTEV